MLLEDAINFAIEAHKKQVRKIDTVAYVSHPLAVMGIMSEFTSSPEVLAACLLHDTVEDCEDITIEIIHERFGEIVGSYVFYATKKSKKEDGSRKHRTYIDRMHYASGLAESQNIKLCDVMHNVPSTIFFKPSFCELYINEKLQLIECLKKADPIIKNKAFNICTSTLEFLHRR